jgi:hypothetical protein
MILPETQKRENHLNRLKEWLFPQRTPVSKRIVISSASTRMLKPHSPRKSPIPAVFSLKVVMRSVILSSPVFRRYQSIKRAGSMIPIPARKAIKVSVEAFINI